MGDLTLKLPFMTEDTGTRDKILHDLPDAFRTLYYHLYTNSKASRAERIIEDLSLLLLLKLASEANGGSAALEKYRLHGGKANQVLIPIVRKTFPEIVDSRQRFSLGDEALQAALQELDRINLSEAPAHVLGEAFQALIGPRLRGDKGQFFTPRSLVKAIVEIVAPKPHESVLDPACGTGGFLLAAHEFQGKLGGKLGRLVGVDKDHDLWRLSSALLHISTRGRARVLNFNSLDVNAWKSHADKSDELFDVVVTNPPFGARIGVTDRHILQSYAFGYQWVYSEGSVKWVQTGALVASQDPQILFLEACVRKLIPGGRLGIVLPEGLFGNKGDSYIWEWLRTQGQVFALLDCPRTTFQPGTDTKTNVLFFEKDTRARTSNVLSKEKGVVRIAVAMNCGHDRRGRTRLGDGRPFPDDFPVIAKAFHKNGDDYIWQSVRIQSGSYMVPRYYAKQRPASREEAELTRGAKFVSLSDLLRSGVISVRKGHEVGSDAYGTGQIPFVRTSDISNFEISCDPTKSVSDEIYEKYRFQQDLRPKDLLIVVDGRYRIGATAILTEHNYRCVVQSHLRIVSVLKEEVVCPYELLFALNLPSVQIRIRNLVFVQSTLGTLGRRLLELEIPLLHGYGPWRATVDRFAKVLIERDELLAELRPVGEFSCEL